MPPKRKRNTKAPVDVDFTSFAQQVRESIGDLLEQLEAISEQVTRLEAVIDIGFQKWAAAPPPGAAAKAKKSKATTAGPSTRVKSTASAVAPSTWTTTTCTTRRKATRAVPFAPGAPTVGSRTLRSQKGSQVLPEPEMDDEEREGEDDEGEPEPPQIPYATMPHVVESIVANAPWQSLLVLRKVSRAIHDLADAAIVRHILIGHDITLPFQLLRNFNWHNPMIPRPEWYRVPELAKAVRVVETKCADNEGHLNVLGLLPNLGVVKHQMGFTSIRPPAFSTKTLLLWTSKHGFPAVVGPPSLVFGVETVFFKIHYTRLPRGCRLHAGWDWNLQSIKKVYFHFETVKWFLPNVEHHPLASGYGGPVLVSSIVEIATAVVKRKGTVYLIDPKSWHPSWMAPDGNDENNVDMQARIVAAITASSGGDDYVKVLSKSDIKSHFDDATYALITATN